MVVVTELDCWHSNEIIYQADGRTVDGRHVYVRYRRPWFSVGVGDTYDDAVGADTLVLEAPDVDPDRIDRETLVRLTIGQFEWPATIAGLSNERGVEA